MTPEQFQDLIRYAKYRSLVRNDNPLSLARFLMMFGLTPTPEQTERAQERWPDAGRTLSQRDVKDERCG